MYSLILRNCQLYGSADMVDIAIDGSQIARIESAITETGVQEIDCKDQLVTSPLVESHIHLDSVLTAGQPRFNKSGTLFEGIQLWGERKPTLTREDVQNRSLEALKLMASHGVLYVRTHVDVTE